MTACTVRRSSFVVRPSSFARLLLLAAVVISAPVVVPTAHAVARHGALALEIRDCLQRHGPAQVWRDTFDPDLFYFCAELPDGRWGLQIVRWRARLQHFVERTAFIKNGGDLADLVRYLSQFAEHFTGALPH